jgi:hypothetical protein
MFFFGDLMARNRKTPDWRVPCFAFAANVRSILLGSDEHRFPKNYRP